VQETYEERLAKMTPGRAAIEREFSQMFPWKNFCIVILTHAFIVVAILIRGRMGQKSIAGLKQCDAGFIAWIPLFMVCSISIGVFNVWFVLRHYHNLEAEKYEFLPDDMRWTKTKMLTFMGLSVLAGTGSGTRGAGGGTTMGPVLAALGVNPQVNAATSTWLVFFTASIASLTSALSDRLPMDYAMTIIIISFISGMCGVHALNYFVRKTKRPSMITFGMAIVLSLAGIAILVYGITSTVNKANRGLLNAKFNDLCAGS
jgi:uncharacterized membrane protein YfcA